MWYIKNAAIQILLDDMTLVQSSLSQNWLKLSLKNKCLNKPVFEKLINDISLLIYTSLAERS